MAVRSNFHNSRALSQYMIDLFCHQLAMRTEASVPSFPSAPRTFSLVVIDECKAIINAMVDAFLNPRMSYYLLLFVHP